MNPQKPADIRETISALVDGEASDWEVRKILQQSKESNPGDVDDAGGDSLRKDWAAYQAIGSALRKEPSMGVDISSAVMEAIEDESTPSGFGYFKNLGRTFSQTAIAASVAVIALLGIQQYQVAQNELDGATSIAENSSQAEVSPVVQAPEGFEILRPVTKTVSSSEKSLKQGTTLQIPVDRDQLKAHLDELVQQHSEHSVNLNQEVMPMVRVPASSEAK